MKTENQRIDNYHSNIKLMYQLIHSYEKISLRSTNKILNYSDINDELIKCNKL